jgi:hypothetical protein
LESGAQESRWKRGENRNRNRQGKEIKSENVVKTLKKRRCSINKKVVNHSIENVREKPVAWRDSVSWGIAAVTQSCGILENVHGT